MKTTKSTIIKEAIRLYNSRGFMNVSVDDICEACGITKGSFYHHFKSKDEVMFSYWRQHQEFDPAMLKALVTSNSARETLWLLLEYGITGALKDIGRNAMGDFWRADLRSGNTVLNPFAFMSGDSTAPEGITLMLHYIEKAQFAGEIRRTVPARELLFTYFSALMGLSVNWSTTAEDYDVAKYLRQVFDVVFSA